jgi:protein involved in polysaccharide export with SLBB domain
LLEEHDSLRISGVPSWSSPATVELRGEITFPGSYRIRKGETLGKLLARAGGLTDAAFPEGAVFLRESLRQREQDQMDMLAGRLEADLNSLALENKESTDEDTLSTGQNLLRQLRTTPAVGRLVIDLRQPQGAASNFDMAGEIELREGDQLLVPQRSQEVTVIGETQQSASYLYQPGLSMQDYIQMSGGLTRHADKGLIYVVRASGAVVNANRSRWFGRGSGIEILPGDTIVVPIEIDRVRVLTFWGSVTQILYQGAIAVAAIKSFDRSR